MNDKSVVRQIIELENKSVEELREIYDKIMPSPIKTHVSKDYLKPRIAYRLQELALGGLKDEIKSKLLKIANNHDRPNHIETKNYYLAPKFVKNGAILFTRLRF